MAGMGRGCSAHSPFPCKFYLQDLVFLSLQGKEKLNEQSTHKPLIIKRQSEAHKPITFILEAYVLYNMNKNCYF